MPQSEKKIALRLEQQGFEYYLPLIARKRKWSDRVKVVYFPLFPGYIFVKIFWRRQGSEVFRIQGVKDVIRQEGQPAVLPHSDLENMKRLAENSAELRTDPIKNFPDGQLVVVRFGPFKGLEGFVVRVKNKSRICVRIPLLNQVISTEMDLLDIERAE